MSTGSHSVTLNGDEIARLAGIEAVLRGIYEREGLSPVLVEQADFLRQIIDRSHEEYQQR